MKGNCGRPNAVRRQANGKRYLFQQRPAASGRSAPEQSGAPSFPAGPRPGGKRAGGPAPAAGAAVAGDARAAHTGAAPDAACARAAKNKGKARSRFRRPANGIQSRKKQESFRSAAGARSKTETAAAASQCARSTAAEEKAYSAKILYFPVGSSAPLRRRAYPCLQLHCCGIHAYPHAKKRRCGPEIPDAQRQRL